MVNTGHILPEQKNPKLIVVQGLALLQTGTDGLHHSAQQHIT